MHDSHYYKQTLFPPAGLAISYYIYLITARSYKNAPVRRRVAECHVADTIGPDGIERVAFL